MANVSYTLQTRAEVAGASDKGYDDAAAGAELNDGSTLH